VPPLSWRLQELNGMLFAGLAGGVRERTELWRP
jgi:hypothetical protein